ncbi:hypothetical protein CBM2615_B60057 [Cupriavidus taiwanensis]|uniref:Uncharacterized protein n=1 Tax=Cupriavidus taiwanensis TaxID=164546 RepID=A0A976G525_9BURK|nr:hypothetical protein CBM2614_B50055 [Cupriavidus taiwanensis]SOZ69699.1 hypothetical protein CBM2615_B60057 [Cupriavidus taiwanensis]SOZ72908.1 hypothetical protein CBM2613_B50056 [Cupriavidus taiwanensis]SPA09766.1 hypothetical protein CBM2625_B50055 [Cupriavidus taiwanensis]
MLHHVVLNPNFNHPEKTLQSARHRTSGCIRVAEQSGRVLVQHSFQKLLPRRKSEVERALCNTNATGQLTNSEVSEAVASNYIRSHFQETMTSRLPRPRAAWPTSRLRQFDLRKNVGTRVHFSLRRKA